MIHLRKMGNRLVGDDKEIESKYFIEGNTYRIDLDSDNNRKVRLFFDLKNLESIAKELNQEVEIQYNKRLDDLKDTKPEDIRF